MSESEYNHPTHKLIWNIHLISGYHNYGYDPFIFQLPKKLVFEYLLTLKVAVIVGVVLRRVEQYDLVKIKPMLMIK